jgi:hypothetical protein
MIDSKHVILPYLKECWLELAFIVDPSVISPQEM